MYFKEDILVSVDMDDTAFNTNPYIRNALYEGGCALPRAPVWLDLSKYGDVGRRVLTDGEFMRAVDLRPGWEGFGQWVRDIRARYAGHVDFQWLTHRGYHPMAESLSKEALRRNQVDHIRLRCIDPAKHPNKSDWLRANTRSGVHHILVDDFNAISRLPTNGVEGIIAEQYWNRDINDLPKFSTFLELRSLLETRFEGLMWGC